MEDIAERLPANVRAAVEWFPQALRSAFIEPLCAASPAHFQEALGRAIVPAARLLLRLLASLSGLASRLSEDSIRRVLHDPEREREQHESMARRLEPIDVDAADTLREAYEWLRLVLTATTIDLPIDLREESADLGDEMELLSRLSEDDLRLELVGETGTYFRGLLLTISAVDLVLEDRPIPTSIHVWADLAWADLQSCVSTLRARGLALSSEVSIPGFTREAWRARRRARAAVHQAAHRMVTLRPHGGPCPPGVLERIVEELHPEEIWFFGSRARGTAQEESDWDLLVVLPDTAPIPDRVELWSRLRDLARQRIDLNLLHRSDFEADREALGTLAQIVTTEGHLVYGR